ncbi:hypothetical protein Q3G72_026120 [Acer saccharum]|nr:hypothetical protein Q3G72_026120 [Acer saccharum]
MELTLSLEKLVNEKLLNLHSVADRHNDPQMTDFIESEFLTKQACGTLTKCFSTRAMLHDEESVTVLVLFVVFGLPFDAEIL